MRRREVLWIAAAGVATLATRATSQERQEPQPGRGLWRDRLGAFAIGRFPEFGPGLFAFDYADQRVGPLAVDERNGGWTMASTLNGQGPPLRSIGSRLGRLLTQERVLEPVPIRRAAFEVQAGEITIAGEIASIEGIEPRATLLMIYGSGGAVKEAFDPWAFWFLQSGFAVVTTDKRGTGRSGGDWRVSGLEELAADAAAVARHAKRTYPRKPLVAWGASQAGWIMPQLGAVGLIDRIMMHAGSALTPKAQIVAAVVAELAAYGFPPEEIERARHYYSLDVEVSRGARSWNEIQQAYTVARNSGAEWILAPPAAADANERILIRRMADFDPEPYWRANRAPVLAIFGGKDWVVPAPANLSALRSMVPPEGALTTVVLPEANHLMFRAQTGVTAEYGSLSQVEPDYFRTMSSWLAA